MIPSQVICVGEALVDQISTNSDGVCKNYLGGAPANVACALSKLGIATAFIGSLGDDKFGKKFLNLFRELAINSQFIQIDKNFPTRIIKVFVDKNGDRSFAGFANSQNFFADEMLDGKLIESNKIMLHNLLKDAKYLITGTNLLASEKSSEALLTLINNASNSDISIVIDANWRDIFWHNSKDSSQFVIKDQVQKIKKFLSKADILKLSHEEANLFFDDDNPCQISKSLSKNPDVIITNGEKPISWFIDGIQDVTQVSKASRIIDTTGAGDSFLAGLISQFLSQNVNFTQKTLGNHIQFASTCGLITCLGEGAIEPQPSVRQIQDFLRV